MIRFDGEEEVVAAPEAAPEAEVAEEVAAEEVVA